MDAIAYKNILANNLFQSAAKMGLDYFYFQHDNDPKHTSKFYNKYLEFQEINTLDWPTQSPDLNPIEHVWALIKTKLREFYAKNKN